MVSLITQSVSIETKDSFIMRLACKLENLKKNKKENKNKKRIKKIIQSSDIKLFCAQLS